ncbi:MarR family winged helix-turn-helix transcriptional regulator [Kitasatospora sp. NBC_01302]|uniref:MarR family winged helix-turn-helix transcriptional regulator n=1 Tax=Kitasatospora sp. NBC_01302 TaxID=2903575 RepID=UPI002E0F8BCF|nr:MarR family winged helix-turn-helix transcriptional regulator [Kitasatospora sp. NBC_01302]
MAERRTTSTTTSTTTTRTGAALTGHQSAEPDLGVLAAQVLFSVQRELFGALAEQGFDDIQPRAGAVLAYLRADGIRASELARVSGQHKQVIGTLVDDLERLGYVERRPDPADRRAKLVCPTDRGLLQMAAATAIMRAIEDRHAKALGAQEYAAFKTALHRVAELQRTARHDGRDTGTPSGGPGEE